MQSGRSFASFVQRISPGLTGHINLFEKEVLDNDSDLSAQEKTEEKSPWIPPEDEDR